MISVTKLLFAREYFGDRLRYTKNAHTMRNGAAEGVGPVVVWNSTKTCNLRCMHCYMQSDAKKYQNELTTEEPRSSSMISQTFMCPCCCSRAVSR